MTVACTRCKLGIFFLACWLLFIYHAYHYYGPCWSPYEIKTKPVPSFDNHVSERTDKSASTNPDWYIDCLGRRKIEDVLRVGLDDVKFLKEFPPLEKIDFLIKKSFDRLNSEKANDFCTNASLILTNESYWSFPVTVRWKLALKIFATIGIKQRLPDVIGIGVKKSGSTALKGFMSYHPNIRLPHIYEPHYFDWRYFMGNIQSYMAMMPLLADDQICYEKTPRYFVTRTAPWNIARDISPMTKFILCVRDPAKRALSDWHHKQSLLLERKNVKLKENTALSEGIRFSEEILTKDGEIDVHSEFIDTSNYARHFEEWLKVFPLSQFLIVKEEDIRNNPFFVLQKVEHFLGLPSYYKPEMFIYNENVNATCFSEAEFKTIRCVGFQQKDLKHPEPYETVIKKMRDFFRPHNHRFEEMTGMRFEWTNL